MKQYSKTISLKNRVYSWDDIQQLIQKPAEILKVNDGIFSASFYFDDDTTITLDNIDDLQDSAMLRKKTNRISFSGRTHSYDCTIEFNLYAGDYGSAEIYFKANENEKLIMDALISRIDDVLLSVSRQSFLSRLKDHLLFRLIPLLGALGLTFCVSKIVKTLSMPILNVINLILIIAFICLFEWVSKAYPKVELNFGPTEQNKPLQKKRLIAIVIGAIILPIILSFLYDFLKGFCR